MIFMKPHKVSFSTALNIQLLKTAMLAKSSSNEMDKFTKLLAVGIACGFIVASLGLANTYRLERKIENLSAACVAEGQRDRNTPDAPAWKRDSMVCDPKDLAKNTAHIPPGIQGELVRAQLALDLSRNWPLLLAVAIASALSLPWCWYFLLNRVKELREALIGR